MTICSRRGRAAGTTYNSSCAAIWNARPVLGDMEQADVLVLGAPAALSDDCYLLPTLARFCWPLLRKRLLGQPPCVWGMDQRRQVETLFARMRQIRLRDVFVQLRQACK